MTSRSLSFLGQLLVVLSSIRIEARGQEIRLLAQAEIPATSKDQLGETIGGIGSGLAFNPANGKYFALSDRGPGDGTIEYRPRFHTLDVQLIPGEKTELKVAVSATTLLRDRDGKPMTGLHPDVAGTVIPQMSDGRTCIDPEAIAVAPDGTIYVADEYGPFLYQFKPDGTMLRRIQPLENYLPRTAQGVDFTENAALVSGRKANHGFEGLALSPDGQTATLLLQNALVQDGGKKCRFTRILVIDLKSAKAIAEYPYQFTDPEQINLTERLRRRDRLKEGDLTVSELVYWKENQFLVLERDHQGADGSKGPKPAMFKSIYLIDTSNATNLLAVPNTPYEKLSKENRWRPLSAGCGVTPVTKKLLLNFVPAGRPADFPEKWEGIALSFSQADGVRHLLVASDNDFLAPTLTLNGGSVSFPRAQRSISTRFLLFDVKLP